MIFIYISNTLYDNYKVYLDLLINNYGIELILFTNYENIKNINTFDSINIFCDILNEYILKKLTLLDSKCYLLNIKNLELDDDYSYLKDYKINIINYNILHKNILKNYLNINTQLYLLPIILDQKFIKKYNKIYDVAVININDDYKNNIVKRLKNDNIIVNNISNCKKEDSYHLLFKHKIFINFNDNNLFDEIICNYCIYNKIIIINCKKRSYINISNLYELNSYSIEISDNLLNNIIIYILNNYDKIYNDIYNNLNDELIYENKRIADNFFNNLSKKNINVDKFGFIILRHVNSEITNKYWIECYNCIRKFYNDKIIIIDDNSDYNYINSDIELINCIIIKSEIHGAGEILGYYYFHKFHYFEKAFILHDSVFINKYIDFSIFDNEKIKYLWHFTHDWDNEKEELALLNIFNNLELKKFYYKKDNWYGCYGLQSIIDYNFLNSIVEKYNLFILLKYVNSRSIRMNLERIFSVLCTYEYNNLKDNPSIYGIIHHYIHWGYTFESYLIDSESTSKNRKDSNKLNHYDLIKVWTGR